VLAGLGEERLGGVEQAFFQLLRRVGWIWCCAAASSFTVLSPRSAARAIRVVNAAEEVFLCRAI
jgi:hypothetical protein